MLDINKIIQYRLKSGQFFEEEHPKNQIYLKKGLFFSEDMVYIYALSHTVKIDDIFYIGKTEHPEIRIESHWNDKLSNPLRPGFSHKTHIIGFLKSEDEALIMDIVDVVPKSEWEFWEEYWICQFKAWGFNLSNKSKGGNSPPKMIGEENPMRREDVREKFRGKKNCNYGKIGALNHRSKSVLVFDKLGNFKEELGSMRLAQKKYNYDFSTMVRCCQGKLRFCKNHIFKYKSDFKVIPLKIEVTKRKINFRKWVLCFDLKNKLLGRFENVQQASNRMNVSYSIIRCALSNKKKKRKLKRIKHIWKYE